MDHIKPAWLGPDSFVTGNLGTAQLKTAKRRGRPPKDPARNERRRNLLTLMAELQQPEESVGDFMLRAFAALSTPVILPSAPAEERFWMVYNATKGMPPRKRHGSNAAARNEALRLARRYTPDVFVVLEARWGVHGLADSPGFQAVQFADQRPATGATGSDAAVNPMQEPR